MDNNINVNNNLNSEGTPLKWLISPKIQDLKKLTHSTCKSELINSKNHKQMLQNVIQITDSLMNQELKELVKNKKNRKITVNAILIIKNEKNETIQQTKKVTTDSISQEMGVKIFKSQCITRENINQLIQYTKDLKHLIDHVQLPQNSEIGEKGILQEINIIIEYIKNENININNIKYNFNKIKEIIDELKIQITDSSLTINQKFIEYHLSKYDEKTGITSKEQIKENILNMLSDSRMQLITNVNMKVGPYEQKHGEVKPENLLTYVRPAISEIIIKKDETTLPKHCLPLKSHFIFLYFLARFDLFYEQNKQLIGFLDTKIDEIKITAQEILAKLEILKKGEKKVSQARELYNCMLEQKSSYKQKHF